MHLSSWKKRGCGNEKWKYSCLRNTWWSSDTRRMRRDPPLSPRARSRVWKREEFVARRNATNKRVTLIGMHRANGYAPRWYGVKSFCQRSVESVEWSTRQASLFEDLRIDYPRVFLVHSKASLVLDARLDFIFRFYSRNTLKNITLDVWNTSVVFSTIIYNCHICYFYKFLD